MSVRLDSRARFAARAVPRLEALEERAVPALLGLSGLLGAPQTAAALPPAGLQPVLASQQTTGPLAGAGQLLTGVTSLVGGLGLQAGVAVSLPVVGSASLGLNLSPNTGGGQGAALGVSGSATLLPALGGGVSAGFGVSTGLGGGGLTLQTDVQAQAAGTPLLTTSVGTALGGPGATLGALAVRVSVPAAAPGASVVTVAVPPAPTGDAGSLVQVGMAAPVPGGTVTAGAAVTTPQPVADPPAAAAAEQAAARPAASSLSAVGPRLDPTGAVSQPVNPVAAAAAVTAQAPAVVLVAPAPEPAAAPPAGAAPASLPASGGTAVPLPANAAVLLPLVGGQAAAAETPAQAAPVLVDPAGTAAVFAGASTVPAPQPGGVEEDVSPPPAEPPELILVAPSGTLPALDALMEAAADSVEVGIGLGWVEWAPWLALVGVAGAAYVVGRRRRRHGGAAPGLRPGTDTLSL